MNDWRTLLVGLGFVYFMTRVKDANYRAMKLGALLVNGARLPDELYGFAVR